MFDLNEIFSNKRLNIEKKKKELRTFHKNFLDDLLDIYLFIVGIIIRKENETCIKF